MANGQAPSGIYFWRVDPQPWDPRNLAPSVMRPCFYCGEKIEIDPRIGQEVRVLCGPCWERACILVAKDRGSIVGDGPKLPDGVPTAQAQAQRSFCRSAAIGTVEGTVSYIFGSEGAYIDVVPEGTVKDAKRIDQLSGLILPLHGKRVRVTVEVLE